MIDSYDNVMIGLKKIIKKLFNMDLANMKKEMLDINLLSIDFALTPVDLLCLYMSVEEEFGISISEEEIVAGHFDTINNIACIIRKELQNQSVPELCHNA